MKELTVGRIYDPETMHVHSVITGTQEDITKISNLYQNDYGLFFGTADLIETENTLYYKVGQMLMNPHTGTVQSAEDWAWDGYDQRNAELIEVVKDENGDWVDA